VAVIFDLPHGSVKGIMNGDIYVLMGGLTDLQRLLHAFSLSGLGVTGQFRSR
jgi:hypothetical protein